MEKLNPPVIDGTIPATYEGAPIRVPYTMNRAVSLRDGQGFALLVKNVQNNLVVLVDTTSNNQSFSESGDAVFYTDYKNFNVGEYYKVQIAYKRPTQDPENPEIGTYSTVAVMKYTGQPRVGIDGFSKYSVNSYNQSITGTYENFDTTEKVYTYRFVLSDDTGVVEDSGYLVHNSNFDVELGSSSDTYSFNVDIEDNKTYTVVYEVTTQNNLTVSASYQMRGIKNDVDISFNEIFAELNRDEAYVDITVEGIEAIVAVDSGLEEYGGKYYIQRKEINSNVWETADSFIIDRDVIEPLIGTIPIFTIRDYAIESGKTYIYGVQREVTGGHRSERITTTDNPLTVYYEDMFLWDGKKQLKIRFNPDVSSFKTTKQEAKIETIGNAYPYIYRNGYINYKEFPINGLISYQMDDNQLFMTDKEMGLIENNEDRKKTAAAESGELLKVRTTGLQDYNFYAERQFKLTLLDWLNDGKAKLFKSPTEGVYLVQIMNVALSPENTVGRMIHSFSAQAVEIAKANYKSLLALGLRTESILDNANQESDVVIPYEDKLAKKELLASGQEAIQIKITHIDPDAGTIYRYYSILDNEYKTIIVIGGEFIIEDRVSSLMCIGGYVDGDAYSYDKDTPFADTITVKYANPIAPKEDTVLSETFKTVIGLQDIEWVDRVLDWDSLLQIPKKEKIEYIHELKLFIMDDTHIVINGDAEYYEPGDIVVFSNEKISINDEIYYVAITPPNIEVTFDKSVKTYACEKTDKQLTDLWNHLRHFYDTFDTAWRYDEAYELRTNYAQDLKDTEQAYNARLKQILEG